MTGTNWGHFSVGAAVAVVAVSIYVLGFYDVADRTYYQCESGEPLESEYQSRAAHKDFYSSYRGDYTPEQIARSCSQQVANAYSRALACGIVVVVDDVDEGELYRGIGSSDRRLGPFFMVSLGEFDAEYRLMVNRGQGWEETKISDVPYSSFGGGGPFDLSESCEGVGFYFGGP